ncbi:PD40 domain-containing protein [Crocinitomix catalasitica]|uniref:PD40 domain-containing protein n=1 Tax=Crocinitomix catalasitica TaxID=184607 RepID=UPI00146F9662|nr:PD40 domain-containing protein [Crocinitomix catalasitica]
MKTQILTLILVIVCGNLFAQASKEEIRANLESASFTDKFDVGTNLMFDKLYQDALYVWEILIEEDQKNANLLYKKGLTLIRLNRDNEAFESFDKAQYAVNKKYNPTSASERNAPVDVWYYLAKSNHLKGDVDEAFTQYKYFIDNVNSKHNMVDAAELGLAQCKVAKELLATPKNYQIDNVGDAINGAGPDYSPVITIDGTTLFYTTKRMRKDSMNYNILNKENGQYYEDIYVSYKDREGNWSSPNYLDFCLPRSNDASISSSADGQTVFVYKDVNGGDIYFSEIADTTFINLKPFDALEINTEYWESHATISNDGNAIYFVSDRPGGLGGRDIYRLIKLPNGEWSKALNIGAPINTPYDEDAPFLGVDSKTMYYSSNGATSMGGFDIFVTQLGDDDVWTDPRNMGAPLNTTGDDIFYTTTADGRTGYYSSERDDAIGDKDIYSVSNNTDYIQNIAVLTGFIRNSQGSKIPSGISIMVSDLTEGTPAKKFTPRMRDGGYVLTLIPCHTYQLDYFFGEKQIHERELYVPCNSSYQDLKHDLLLDPISLETREILSDDDELIKKSREEGMTCDLVYKVQVGAFKNPLPVKYYKNFNPITTEPLGLNITRYMVGNYKQYIKAEEIRRSVLNDFPGAFVVAYLNGIRIETTVARDLEYGVRKCDESLYPKELIRTDSIANYTDLIEKPEFVYFLDYNKDKFDYKIPEFRVFMQGVKDIVDQNLNVTIYITASASRVPTRSYKDNQDLAVHRLNNGNKALIKLLKEFDIDVSKVNTVLKEASVNGPSYKSDPVKNETAYKAYQYIKFEIKF